MTSTLARRNLLRNAVTGAGAALGWSGLTGDAAQAAVASTIPWIKRVFHLYTGPDGLTRAEQVKVPPPPSEGGMPRLLRRKVERLTLNAAPPHNFLDFHPANQPTLLIPLFGSIIVGLADGKTYEFGHGDFAFAEDCNGKGHTSQAGAQGSFTVQVQFLKSQCLPSGSTDMEKFWIEPD